MRASVKLSVIAIAAASLIGGSAAAAVASERSYKRSHDQTNVCGNNAQWAEADRGGENDQNVFSRTLCQTGKDNKHIVVFWDPEFTGIL